MSVHSRKIRLSNETLNSEIGVHACPRLGRPVSVSAIFQKIHVRVRVRGVKKLHVRVRVRDLKKFHVHVRVRDLKIFLCPCPNF